VDASPSRFGDPVGAGGRWWAVTGDGFTDLWDSHLVIFGIFGVTMESNFARYGIHGMP